MLKSQHPVHFSTGRLQSHIFEQMNQKLYQLQQHYMNKHHHVDIGTRLLT